MHGKLDYHQGGYGFMNIKSYLALLTLAVCCLIPMPAWARWQTIERNAQGTLSFHVDTLKLLNKDQTIRVFERQIPSDPHKQGSLQHNEYDLKAKQWRTRSSYVINHKGKKLAGTKKIGPWKPLLPLTETMTHARYYRDYARVKGPWTFIKTLPNTGKKWINPKTLKKTGDYKYEVWEKTKLNHVSSRVKWVISLTEYNTEKKTALTKYICTFDPTGYMTSYDATKDKWSLKEDVYGEYIGDSVAEYYRNHVK
jgi:hypothetical protein